MVRDLPAERPAARPAGPGSAAPRAAPAAVEIAFAPKSGQARGVQGTAAEGQDCNWSKSRGHFVRMLTGYGKGSLYDFLIFAWLS